MCNKDNQSLITEINEVDAINSSSICSILGCTNRVHARGLCRKHYMINYRNRKKNENPLGSCKVHNCKNKIDHDGYCTKHLKQIEDYGRIYTEDYKISHCRVEGCSGKITCRGYCARHYNMYLKYGKIVKEEVKNNICSIPNCNEKVYCKGMCIKHYNIKRYLQKIEIDAHSINTYLGGKHNDNGRTVCRR